MAVLSRHFAFLMILIGHILPFLQPCVIGISELEFMHTYSFFKRPTLPAIRPIFVVVRTMSYILTIICMSAYCVNF